MIKLHLNNVLGAIFFLTLLLIMWDIKNKIGVSDTGDIEIYLLGSNGTYEDDMKVCSPISGARSTRDGYIQVSFFGGAWAEIPFDRISTASKYGTANGKELAKYLATNSFFKSGNSIVLPIAQSDVSGLEPRFEDLENKILTRTLYETITSPTSIGSIATQAGIEIIRDSFGGADLDVTAIGADNYPNGKTILDSLGNIVTANFNPVDTPPDWQLDNSDTNGQNYALIFRVRGSRKTLDEYSTLNSYPIIDEGTEYDFSYLHDGVGGSKKVTVTPSGELEANIFVDENTINISEFSELPTPVGGVIDLGDNSKKYKFTSIIDLQGNTIDFGNNVIEGLSQELGGVQNGSILVDQTCTVYRFRINSCDTIINAIGGAFDWEFVNFYDCNLVDIQRASNIVWQTFGFINTYNVQVSGEIDSLVISPNCIWRSVVTQNVDFLAIRSTAIINRRVRIQDSVFATSFANQAPIRVEAGAQIGIESFIMKVVRFSGAGSIQGINGDSDTASFKDCVGDGVVNSTSIVNMYILENQSFTPTPTQGDKYKVVGTSQVSATIQRFAHDALNNTVEYTSSVSRIFKIQMPYTVFAGNNNIVGVYIAVTRSGNAENPNADIIAESEMYTTTNGARPISGASQCITTLNQGDKIYMAVENENGNSVRVEFKNMIIETANV